MATELTVLISGGFHSTLVALTATIERRLDAVVRVVSGPSMGDEPDAIPKRLGRGERADLVVMVADALDALVADGRAIHDSVHEIARSPIGVAVKRGAPIPDISTEDALRATLLRAASIGYSDSASGRYVSQTLFERLGLATVASKAREIQEMPVAEVVASGAIEIGFQEVAEILPVAGAQLIGRLPGALQKITRYAAAVVVGSDRVALGRRVVEFLASPAIAPLVEAEGLLAPAR